MPIRFRCDTCNGKLSIATRKIGNPVECPRCHATMTVPSVSQLGEELTELLMTVGRRSSADDSEDHRPVAASAPSRAVLDDLPLFERSDFEKLLDPHAKPNPAPIEEERPTKSMTTSQPKAAHDPTAIVLSRTTATLLVAGVVVLVGLAFGLGFLVRG